MNNASWNVKGIVDHFGGVLPFCELMEFADRSKVDQWVNRNSIPSAWLANIHITAKAKRRPFTLAKFVITKD